MVDLDEVCGVLQCCRHDSDDSESNNDVSIYIGIIMLVASEVLPFVGVKANGVLHFMLSLLKN